MQTVFSPVSFIYKTPGFLVLEDHGHVPLELTILLAFQFWDHVALEKLIEALWGWVGTTEHLWTLMCVTEMQGVTSGSSSQQQRECAVGGERGKESDPIKMQMTPLLVAAKGTLKGNEHIGCKSQAKSGFQDDQENANQDPSCRRFPRILLGNLYTSHREGGSSRPPFGFLSPAILI